MDQHFCSVVWCYSLKFETLHPIPLAVVSLVHLDPRTPELDHLLGAIGSSLVAARVNLDDHPAERSIGGHGDERLDQIAVLQERGAFQVRAESLSALGQRGPGDQPPAEYHIVRRFVLQEELNLALAVGLHDFLVQRLQLFLVGRSPNGTHEQLNCEHRDDL